MVGESRRFETQHVFEVWDTGSTSQTLRRRNAPNRLIFFLITDPSWVGDTRANAKHQECLGEDLTNKDFCTEIKNN